MNTIPSTAMSSFQHTEKIDDDGSFWLEIFSSTPNMSFCVLSLDDDCPQTFAFSQRLQLKVVCPKTSQQKVAFHGLKTKTNKTCISSNDSGDIFKEEVKEENNGNEYEAHAKKLLDYSLPQVEPESNEFDCDFEHGESTDDHDSVTEKEREFEPDNSENSVVFNSVSSDMKKEEESQSATEVHDDDNENLNSLNKKLVKSSINLKKVGKTVKDPSTAHSSSVRHGFSKDKTVSKSSASGPSLSRNEEKMCPFCDKTFPNFYSFRKHRHNPKFKWSCKKETHKCDQCKQPDGSSIKFPTKAALLSHNCVHHSSDKQGEEGDSNRKTYLMKHPCSICALPFETERKLTTHLKEHTGELPYICCVCGQHTSSWKRHENCRSGLRFKCLECRDRFCSRAELMAHQKTHNLKCRYCGMEFLTTASRNQHLLVVHQKDGLRCKICDKLVKNEISLKGHMRYHKYHSDNREECPVCGIVVSYVERHLRTTHKIADTPFVCDKCPRTFSKARSFKEHFAQHTDERPFACDYCPKKFKMMKGLSKHLNIHNKIKSYICEQCGHKSTTSGNLNIHRRIHRKEKLFPCMLCSKSFNYKASLQGHMKSQHKLALPNQTPSSNVAL